MTKVDNSAFEDYGTKLLSGWSKLIRPLIEQCNKEQISIAQIKEKFGGLRFYIYSATKDSTIWDAIDKAEDESYKICEDCGEPGSLRSGSWLLTLCDKHWKEVQEERAAQLKRYQTPRPRSEPESEEVSK